MRGEVKQIFIGFIALIVLFLLSSIFLSVTNNQSIENSFQTSFFKIFFPKTGGDSSTPGLSVFYLITAFISIGIIYFIIENLIIILLKTDLYDIAAFIKMKQLKNHYIIIGGGEVGLHAANELLEDNKKFVIIEQNEKLVTDIKKKGHLVIQGDALLEETLSLAKVENAKAIILGLSDEGDSLFIIITAKNMNKKINIGCRAKNVTILKKLKQAGADFVVMPEYEAANRLVEYVTN